MITKLSNPITTVIISSIAESMRHLLREPNLSSERMAFARRPPQASLRAPVAM
jgi:hypothetical protein